MAGIFINYRTGDGGRAAEHVDERLIRVFGKSKVFRDRRAMRPGTDFPDRLRTELKNSTVLLALMGPGWLDIREEKTGGRRIDVPGDYVHDEIASALSWHKVVIPVLLDGAKLPDADRMPGGIVKLLNRQALHLPEGYGHRDLRFMTEELRQYVPEKKKRRKDKNRGGTGAVFDFGGATLTRNAIANGDASYNESAEAPDRDQDGSEAS
ncbi:toll/interleukin-1 receptor domain-containing protein [Streptomyces sp. NPDC056749]|uniref:toll/interleukin-1 receptor domain-containing protein n=1 Tax=Streptomyces sp. NPDC056749 TaxID=3345936 RepID=UPI0036897449